jgi:glutamate-ammonia-ligase adenylyltransferase
LADFVGRGPEPVLNDILTDLTSPANGANRRQELQSLVRKVRRRGCFVIALADITGLWDVDRVLEELTRLAERIISVSLSGLLAELAERGEIELADAARPEQACGYTVIGMGKLGARELNYSSDVDLIVIYDPAHGRYRHARGPQEGYVRLTRALVQMLEEPTADGFSYRTDLRLRPDPGAMPLAISYVSAMTYYESIGQNWERAAMIKARPVAGDLELGQALLEELRPFVWRKHLDFYAIQDIHSIKRQIHSHKGGERIAVAGHNVKLGRGGIREIEFFVQTQQLIWGGRNPHLRCARTLDGLQALVDAGHLAADTAEELAEAYRFLRRVENWLQMQDDRQVHALATKPEELEVFAAFLGYEGAQPFAEELVRQLGRVEGHYAQLFEEAPNLSGPGNLVFTGGEPDPGTVETLEKLGFVDGAKVFNLVRSWHHGRYRSTRSTRSRQILTELMPTLLEAMSGTSDPDQALTRFDQFLAGLPTGVQLFAMLHANPKLLELIAEIMGGAPLLAEKLGGRPGLLDAVLSMDFFEAIPPLPQLEQELSERLREARDFQDSLDLSQRWANDRRFQVGVHVLRATLDVDETGFALSDIADCVLRTLTEPVTADFARRHGRIENSAFAILAMGKLGGREMTISSDLDLVFLYDVAPGAGPSNGERPLEAGEYFAKLAQRFINAVTARTPEGVLYEIDMRLRPSGKSGPIASSLASFLAYYDADAWTWEHMALTRARLVRAEPELGRQTAAGLRAILTAQRDPEALLKDVAEMRRRIEREKPAKSIWSVKYLRGGLIDLEFIAQYLQLCHAAQHPEVLSAGTEAAFEKLAAAGYLAPRKAQMLARATRFMRQVQGMLRLTVGPAFDADQLPQGLQTALARGGGLEDFTMLRAHLIETAAEVEAAYKEIIDEPAER